MWEAFLQQLNNNKTLQSINQPHINHTRDFENITTKCLEELKLDPSMRDVKVRKLRQHLRDKEFAEWCSYPHKGKGVKLFSEVPSANKWVRNKQNLSSSEWRDMLKMVAMVPPLRSIPGRSTNTSHCRHCGVYESLPHVLGSCPQGELLRIKRHNIVRTLLANSLRSKGLEVYEEVHCLADGDSNRRIDIIAINRQKASADIVDPTIRFEVSLNQPNEVDLEKKKKIMSQVYLTFWKNTISRKFQLPDCSLDLVELFLNSSSPGEINIK